MRALEEVPHREGKELAAYVKSLPGGWQDYTPLNLTPAIEALDVTLTRCRDWTKYEQHHKAIVRYLRPTPPPDTSQGKRKRDDEASESSPRRVIKKVKIEDEDAQRVGLLSVKKESDKSSGSQLSPRRVIKKVKIEDEDSQRAGLLSVKNESDNNNAVVNHIIRIRIYPL